MGKYRRAAEGRPAAPRKSSFSPGRVISWLEKHARAIAIAAILLGSVRIAATYDVFSHTCDEPAHIAAGMEWLDKGTYTWEPQHPPLARVAAALGPYLLGGHSRKHGSQSDVLGMFEEGIRILYHGPRNSDLTLAAARLGVLPFFWIASVVVYEWGRRYFNRATAALAVCIFTFIPAVLAHAGLATTDMALTAFLGAAFLTGLMWIDRPGTRRAALFGLCAGLAILSKFSSLVFFPAAAGLALIWYLASTRPPVSRIWQDIRLRVPTLALAWLVCCLVVWAGYRFSIGRDPVMGVTLPAPQLYAGIRQVETHSAQGHPSFLLGQRGDTGWWYFFPVVLAVKTPLALLILLGIWMVAAATGRLKSDRGWLPVAFALGILLLGMASRIDLGLRHILPVYIGLALATAAAVVWMMELAVSRPVLAWAPAAIAAWLGLSSLLSHPDYLPYFNEVAGSHPENIVVDSDLDWGQDLKRLARRLRELQVPSVAILTGFIADFDAEGVPLWRGKIDLFHPRAGWTAVSISSLKITRLGLPAVYAQYRVWPEVLPPTERIGKGILLWYIPPETTNQVSR